MQRKRSEGLTLEGRGAVDIGEGLARCARREQLREAGGGQGPHVGDGTIQTLSTKAPVAPGMTRSHTHLHTHGPAAGSPVDCPLKS